MSKVSVTSKQARPHEFVPTFPRQHRGNRERSKKRQPKFRYGMGNSESKKLIEQQNTLAAQRRQQGAPAIIDDRIDSPLFDVITEFPAYLKFFCPSATENPTLHAHVRETVMKAADIQRLSFAGCAINSYDMSVLIPLYLRNCKKIQKLDLSGVEVDMGLLTSALFLASPSLHTIDLNGCSVQEQESMTLIEGLLRYAERTKRSPTSPMLTISLTETPFWFQNIKEERGKKLNETLSSDLQDLSNKFNIVVEHPPLPEIPFEINGQFFQLANIDSSRPVASRFVVVETLNFETLDAAASKADFVENIITKMIELQSRNSQERAHLGLRYVPRLYHHQRYSKTLMKIVSDDPTRQQNYTRVAALFREGETSWSIPWRLELVHQVSQVARFLHCFNAALRQIFPQEILVDMQQKRILYVDLNSIREVGAVSKLHHHNGLRFADPIEARGVSEYTLARDLYPLGMLLMYFLVPIDDLKEFKKMVLPQGRSVEGAAEAYEELLNEKIPNDIMGSAAKQAVAAIVAECTQRDENSRPTAAEFEERLQAVINDVTR